MDLVEQLSAETRLPWERHERPGAARLFFGRPLLEGARTIAKYCMVVSQVERGFWHVNLLRYNPDTQRGAPVQAMRVPGSWTWLQMLEIVEDLISRLGGVSPLYAPVRT